MKILIQKICLTLSTYKISVIYFYIKLKLGTKYMIRYWRRYLTLINIVRVSGLFFTHYFLHNGCTFEVKGRVRKGVLTILTLVTFKLCCKNLHMITVWCSYTSKHGEGGCCTLELNVRSYTYCIYPYAEGG